jgi:hypothetical protein
VRLSAGARRLDALAVLALFIAAVVARRDVLPHGLLFPDEAWEALGAAKGSLGNLLTVGFSAPGFTGVLMGWHKLFGVPEQMAYVPFAAGIVTPPLTYVALRRFGSAPSIGLLLGAALASEKLNIVYSGRVKSYVIDVPIVLAFAVLLPRLVRVHFTWRSAVLWVVGSFAVGFFSPFALIASAVAGAILVVKPAGDRAMRVVAVGTQGVLLAVLTLLVRRTYDVKALTSWWKGTYDGFIGFDDTRPFHLVPDLATHLRRVASVFSGGPGWWAALVLIVAIVTLAVDARVRGRSARAVRAQYLLLLLFVAVAAGVADILPFGPVSIGMRLSLWLVPIFVIGGASALDRVRIRLEGHTPIRAAFDVSAVVVAVVLIVGASTGLPANHVNDRGNAAAYVEGALTKNDVVFIDHTNAMYSYAVASHLDVGIRAVKDLVAFEPDFRDPRFHYFQFAGDHTDRVVLTATPPGADTNLARVIGRADRVYIYAPDAQLRGRFSFALALRRLGYRQESDTRFNFARVVVWRRVAQ